MTKKYNTHTQGQYKYRNTLQDKNSFKNMDPGPQNYEKKQFYSDPRDILHEKGTDNFWDLTDRACSKLILAYLGIK